MRQVTGPGRCSPASTCARRNCVSAKRVAPSAAAPPARRRPDRWPRANAPQCRSCHQPMQRIPRNTVGCRRSHSRRSGSRTVKFPENRENNRELLKIGRAAHGGGEFSAYSSCSLLDCVTDIQLQLLGVYESIIKLNIRREAKSMPHFTGVGVHRRIKRSLIRIRETGLYSGRNGASAMSGRPSILPRNGFSSTSEMQRGTKASVALRMVTTSEGPSAQGPANRGGPASRDSAIPSLRTIYFSAFAVSPPSVFSIYLSTNAIVCRKLTVCPSVVTTPLGTSITSMKVVPPAAKPVKLSP